MKYWIIEEYNGQKFQQVGTGRYSIAEAVAVLHSLPETQHERRLVQLGVLAMLPAESIESGMPLGGGA